MASEKFDIRLTVAGMVLPLNIERAKEERYRRAERQLNEMIEKFRRRFRAEGDEQYLAMAALQMALNCVELELRGNMDSEEESLKELDAQLNKYLGEI